MHNDFIHGIAKSVNISTPDHMSLSMHDTCISVSRKFTMNSMQHIAFLICCKAWFDVHLCHLQHQKGINDMSDGDIVHPAQLRMFLTGPGGTGKTHVINAVSEVLAVYGCEHLIRYLAPTGGAAK